MVALNDIRNKREQILHLAASYGARNIRVFGSVLRGQQVETSDLDLLVRMDDDRSLLDHIGLVQDLGDLLGCRVDVVNERVLHRGIRDRVLSEAVPL